MQIDNIYQQTFVSQLDCVKLVVDAQNEFDTGVLAEKASIRSSPVSENCRALLTLAPDDK